MGIESTTHDANPLPVFKQSASEIVSAYAAFSQLALASESKFVTAICFGTLTVTTVNNALWGLPAGITVTLHIIGVSSPLTIGLLEDMHNYDVFVQEVVETVTSEENTETIREHVL